MPARRPPLRSIRNRLALLFFAITAIAVAVIYFYVVPQLESRLRDEKLRSLADAARLYSSELVDAIGTNVDERGVNQRVRQAADRAGARVTLLGVSRGTEGLQTYPISDSTTQVELDDVRFPVAIEAAETGRTTTGSEATLNGRLGEAARPLFFGGRVARVVVFSEPFTDVAASVAVVRRQILVAGGIALLFATLAGYLVARALSVRIKRLEGAAGRVAAGDFSHTIPVDSDDELGQLARAFNDMQAQLAQLDDARKQFIATASHELRTPIFSVSGFAELLADEDLDEPTRAEFLAQLRLQTERLRVLATDLLDLSRLGAGSLELRPEPVDVGELAKLVADEFTPALAEHDSELELRLPPEPLSAELDRERVAQILRGLIDNAIRHNPAGTSIVVSAGQLDGRIFLAVRDDGPGIRHATLPRVFEPFFTSDPRGSGLGLTIARELAERMNGRLTAVSDPKRTEFTLELPA